MGEIIWFIRSLNKTETEETMNDTDDVVDDNDNTMDDNNDHYRMDEKKYVKWKRWCKFSSVFCTHPTFYAHMRCPNKSMFLKHRCYQLLDQVSEICQVDFVAPI